MACGPRSSTLIHKTRRRYRIFRWLFVPNFRPKSCRRRFLARRIFLKTIDLEKNAARPETLCLYRQSNAARWTSRSRIISRRGCADSSRDVSVDVSAPSRSAPHTPSRFGLHQFYRAGLCAFPSKLPSSFSTSMSVSILENAMKHAVSAHDTMKCSLNKFHEMSTRQAQGSPRNTARPLVGTHDCPW